MNDRPADAVRTARLRCIIASGIVLAATIVIVGAITPGYSQLAETVSRLGSRGQPHVLLARTGLVLYGVLVMIGAGPLGARLPGKDRLVAGLIGGYGAASVVTGLAPKDPAAGPHTLMSQIHVSAAIVGGGLLMLAMALTARYAPHRSERLTAASALASHSWVSRCSRSCGGRSCTGSSNARCSRRRSRGSSRSRSPSCGGRSSATAPS